MVHFVGHYSVHNLILLLLSYKLKQRELQIKHFFKLAKLGLLLHMSALIVLTRERGVGRQQQEPTFVSYKYKKLQQKVH